MASSEEEEDADTRAAWQMDEIATIKELLQQLDGGGKPEADRGGVQEEDALPKNGRFEEARGCVESFGRESGGGMEKN